MKQHGRDLIHLPGIGTSLETGTSGHALSAVSPRLYAELEHEARSSTQLSNQQNWIAISRKPLHRSKTEDDLIWLIQVGVLRREVDGQGLTERVRLTPMGRDLLDDWDGEIPNADALQVMHHWLRRHRPRL